MHILNFSHPLTDAQIAQIRALANLPNERITVITISTQIGRRYPLHTEVGRVLGYIPWDELSIPVSDTGLAITGDFLVNPPALGQAAILVVLELEGHPCCRGWLNMRPVTEGFVKAFEVQEII